MKILGISAYYHDSAAALIVDGNIVSAAQEERFTRKKHDARFPSKAISFCLRYDGIHIKNLDYIVFYEKPFLTFDRLIETYLAFAPSGYRSFVVAMPVWIKEKLYLKSLIKKELLKIGNCHLSDLPPLLFAEHHQSHAAAAFFPSPFKRAAIICLDAIGEWATTSAWIGQGNQLLPLWEIIFPHSIGMLYSAFTYYLGFKVNSAEYKLMGLAPYGSPKYVDSILQHLLDLKEDGTFRLNMKYFNFATGLTMTNRNFHNLFGGLPRKPEEIITQRHMDIAASIQKVTEEIVLRVVKTVHQETDEKYLCLAGGVALNCVANGKILRESPFKDIWIQPAAGDAGGAVGAAFTVWHQYCDMQRDNLPGSSINLGFDDNMQGAYLGPQFSEAEIQEYLDSVGAEYQRLGDDELIPKVAHLLADGNIIGWFQGRMEFGPRALGNRSILGDPRNSSMQSIMNLKIKHRESFRPFAPSVLADNIEDFFEIDHLSPYMLLVAPVKKSLQIPMSDEQKNLFGIESLNVPRSIIPAVTHVDYSARIQTVEKKKNPRYYELIQKFKQLTGIPLVVNTSFNVRGEPIVCTPEDAYRCFMRTEMDFLVLENSLLKKSQQPPWTMDESWKKEFELD